MQVRCIHVMKVHVRITGRQGAEKEVKLIFSERINSEFVGRSEPQVGLLSTPTAMQSFPIPMPNRVYFCNWSREPNITMNYAKSPLFPSVKVHCSKPPLYKKLGPPI